MIKFINDVEITFENISRFIHASKAENYFVLHPNILQSELQKLGHSDCEFIKLNDGKIAMLRKHSSRHCELLDSEFETINTDISIQEVVGKYLIIQNDDNTFQIINSENGTISKDNILYFESVLGMSNKKAFIIHDNEETTSVLTENGIIYTLDIKNISCISSDIYTNDNIMILISGDEQCTLVIDYDGNVLFKMSSVNAVQAKEQIEENADTIKKYFQIKELKEQENRDMYIRYIIKKIRSIPELQNMPANIDSLEQVVLYTCSLGLNIILDLITENIIKVQFKNVIKVTDTENDNICFWTTIEELTNAKEELEANMPKR